MRIYAGGGGADSEVAVERAVVEGGHGGHQAAHEGVLGAEAARLGRQQRVLPLQAVAFLLQLHVLGSVSQQRPFVGSCCSQRIQKTNSLKHNSIERHRET